MRLKTELARLDVPYDDAVFHLQELGTSALTEVAVIAIEKGKAASLLPTFLAAVVGWQGVTDKDGRPLDCTDDNKKMIFEANQKVAEHILNALPQIEAMQEAQKKI